MTVTGEWVTKYKHSLHGPERTSKLVVAGVASSRVPCPCMRNLLTSSLRAINIDLWMISHFFLPMCSEAFWSTTGNIWALFAFREAFAWASRGSRRTCVLQYLLCSVLWHSALTFPLAWTVLRHLYPSCLELHSVPKIVLIVIPACVGRFIQQVYRQHWNVTVPSITPPRGN